MEFVHLHNHSEYSLLDGMLKITSGKGKPSEFLKTSAAQGVRAMALTDHGNMFGAVDFYFAAKDVGILPIIGCEMYEAPESRLEKNKDGVSNAHITILAKDHTGYQNMMSMMSEAYINGFYNRPRIDKELLAKHSSGIIILSGCMQSQVAQACLKGNIEEAVKLAVQYRDIVGEGNFYLEIMDHGIPEEKTILEKTLEVAKRTGIPLVATNDCHYHHKEDWQAHDIHLCIATGSTLEDPNRFRMTTHELYFKSADEMKQLFSFCPEAIKNTVEIANKCHVEIPYGKSILPVFPLPSDAGTADPSEYLRGKCLVGLKEKLESDIPQNYMDRLEFELGIIKKMGFPDYFLIVSDFINESRKMGIPVGPGRGSGAGSLVSYSLDITRVDPIINGLLFERFLNPDRISMPDLDIDFSDEGRTRVIEYVRSKYGANNVANIITFGTIKAKLAIKDVARVMGLPPADANRLSKLIPNALDATIASALESVPELSQESARDPKIKQLLDYAQKIEGLKRHTGVHAAGVVVTREELPKYAPLSVGAKKIVTTQYEGVILEKLGLLKMDFLGLRTLTVIDKAVEMVKKQHNIPLDISKIRLDDAKTYDLLKAGDTLGVFQLESRGMRDLVKALKPSQFSDISALVALYRPGPMQSGMLEVFVSRKHGRKKITYDHPLLEPILKETYGTLVYQEQVMEISKSLAGFTPGQSDGLRKAMGKKNMEAMQKERERFMEGCKKKDIQPALAKKIFDQMEQFASYGFNKSHSVAYALVAYQTAFLKANYPAEFMTAALTSEIGHNAIGADDKENKIVTYLDESRRMGIPVLGPDIQASFQDFSIEDTEDGQKAIRFGLHAVKNVGDEASRSMVATREESGKFKSLHDLCMRIDLRQANRKTLESLSKAGALDSLYPELGREEARARVLADLDKEIAASACLKEEENSGQSSLFDIHEATCAAQTSQEAGSIEPLSEHELLNNEKEVLGFYLSGHPLVRYEKQLHMIAADRISELSETSSDDEENPEPQAKTACIAGIIAGIQKKQSRAKKEPWAQLVVEDLTGRITVNVFPKNYPASANAIKADNIVAIRGRISIRPESDPPEVEIVADEVIPLSQAISRYGRCIKIKISAAAPELKMKELGKLLTAHRGDTPAYIVAELPKGKKALIQTELCVALGDPLFEDLDKTVGSRGWLVESGTPSAAPEKPFRRAKTGK